jgi:hypothetical protein
MSVVYRAADTQLRREVAIKVMHAFLAEQQEARERFHREAMAVARLRHPHIIEIFDYSGEDANTSFIVTELVEGQALSEMLKQSSVVPPEAALVLARPIAEALMHAHNHGVIHRDLKPENILIAPDGTLKLTDFGIARMLDTHTLTMTGTLLGSPAYMAPEYVEGYATDERADIFSFGAMLYQLAVGRLPFEAPTPHALLKRVATSDFVPAQQANTQIHARIAGIISRCLARLPENRYLSAEQMLRDIDDFLERIGIQADRALPELLADPAGFGERLVGDLGPTFVALGKAELRAGATGPAIDDFDRVLSLDPHNAEVRHILDRLARHAWLRRAGRDLALALVGAALITLAAGHAIDAYRIDRVEDKTDTALPPSVAEPDTPVDTLRVPVTLRLLGTGDLHIDGELQQEAVTGLYTLLLEPGDHDIAFSGADKQARQKVTVPKSPPERGKFMPPPMDVSIASTPVRPAPLPPKIKKVEFVAATAWVNAFVDGQKEPVATGLMGKFVLPLAYGKRRVRFVNPSFRLWEREISVGAETPPTRIVIRLIPLPARLDVSGLPEGAVVEVAGKTHVVRQYSEKLIRVPLERAPQEYEVVVRVNGRESKQRVLFKPDENHTLKP